MRESTAAPWLAVATVCIGAFMGQLDASIVTQALPTLASRLGGSVAATQWVALAYLLVLVGLLPIVGRIADMVGRKLLYIYGFVVFIVGSILCGLAPSLDMLVAARALQGLGAALLQANSLAIIVHAAPTGRLGRAIGFQGGAQALGLALGPALGGLLIGIGGWRLIFFVNVPAGVAGAILGWFLIPRSRELSGRVSIDWYGIVLVASAAALLLIAVSFVAAHGVTSPTVVGSFGLALVLTVLLVRRERRAAHPIIPPSLFTRPAFTVGILSGLLSYLVLFGVLFVVPFLLEIGHGDTAGSAGLVLVVLPVSLGITAPIAGRLGERFGVRSITVSGMALTALSLMLAALTSGDGPGLVVALLLGGVGLGAFTPANNAAVMGSVPRGEAGVASGVLNMTRGFGTAIGLAATSLVYVEAAGGGTPSDAIHGFVAAAWMLAGLAAASAALATARGPVRVARDATLAID